MKNMFTGIVENKGKIIKRQDSGGIVRFKIGFVRKEKRKLQIGESIANDGVCLTAVKVSPGNFEVDVVRETLASTTLGDLKKGDLVNLERSLRYGDVIGGHFVTGHVDGKGQIAKIERQGKNWLFWFQASKQLSSILAHKGSVAVDGISLTIQGIQGRKFKIAIIPHTLQETTLGKKKAGDWVNLEIDMITRYLLVLPKRGAITRPRRLALSKLIKQGF